MNHPEATSMALSILRSGDPFQWYVITLLALTLYVYLNEFSKKNWKGIAAGLSLYMVHWFVEIVNALIQHFSGHALWTVPTGTAFLILVGVGIEISLMFSIAGLILSKLLPEDTGLKIAGINNRLLFAIANAAFYSIFEIFLVKTPTFVWVWPWWGPSRFSLPCISRSSWPRSTPTTGHRRSRRPSSAGSSRSMPSPWWCSPGSSGGYDSHEGVGGPERPCPRLRSDKHSFFVLIYLLSFSSSSMIHSSGGRLLMSWTSMARMTRCLSTMMIARSVVPSVRRTP